MDKGTAYPDSILGDRCVKDVAAHVRVHLANSVETLPSKALLPGETGFRHRSLNGFCQERERA